MTHRLGVRRGLRLLWILLGGTIILMALTLLLGRNNARVLGAGLAAGTVLLSVMIVDGLFIAGPSSLRRSYYLSILCAGICLVLLRMSATWEWTGTHGASLARL